MAFDGKGLVCPQCGGSTDVIDSRPNQGSIRRRRVCEQGHRFSTTETIIAAKPPKPPARPAKLAPLSLPLTYLTIAQKERARQFFRAGWKVHEVAKLFDMTTEELRK